MKTKDVLPGSQTPDLDDFIAPQTDFSLSHEDIVDMVRRTVRTPNTPSAPPQILAYKTGDGVLSRIEPIMVEMTPAELIDAMLPGRVQQED
ncbi:MAG: hypothetical protein ACR2QC_10835 [Gammaproteobacteria bacterium]